MWLAMYLRGLGVPTIRDASYMIMEKCISIGIPPEVGGAPKTPAFARKVILNFECIIQY